MPCQIILTKVLYFNQTWSHNKIIENCSPEKESWKTSVWQRPEFSLIQTNWKSEIRNTHDGTYWYLLIQSIPKNVKQRNTDIAKTHEKNISKLTYKKVLAFTPDDVIGNLSSNKMFHKEANIIKERLRNSIPTEALFVNYDLIHFYQTKD